MNEQRNTFTNPYDILGVSPAASKAEIAKAFGLAMKQKKYPVKVITQAQKELLNQEQRILADYLRPILPLIKRFKHYDLSELDNSIPDLDLLEEFSDFSVNTNITNQVSDFDRQIGEALLSSSVFNK